MDIILASTSPFRKKQLEEMGLNFKAIAPIFDEEAFKSNKYEPTELCEILGRKKALSLVEQFPSSIIIGSDQIMVCDGQMFNKPKTMPEVIKRLSHLQNKTHSLLTSLFVYTPNKNYSHLDQTHLQMKPLSEDEILKYAEQDQPLGCAGGYKYELNGQNLFENVDSQDPSSIIGLPTLALEDIIKMIKG